MSEDEEALLRKQLAALETRVETLQHLLERAVRELPERAMLHIEDAAMAYVKSAEDEARRRDRDDLRDRAAAIHDVCVSMANAIDGRLADHYSGGIIRTVQPFPITPEAMRFPDLGY